MMTYSQVLGSQERTGPSGCQALRQRYQRATMATHLDSPTSFSGISFHHCAQHELGKATYPVEQLLVL